MNNWIKGAIKHPGALHETAGEHGNAVHWTADADLT